MDLCWFDSICNNTSNWIKFILRKSEFREGTRVNMRSEIKFLEKCTFEQIEQITNFLCHPGGKYRR